MHAGCNHAIVNSPQNNFFSFSLLKAKTMIPQNISQLKKSLTIGQKLELVRHDWIGGKVINGFRIGMIREIVAKNSVEISFSPAIDGAPISHMRFPASRDFQPTENGFRIALDKSTDKWMEYRFIK